MQRNTIQIDEPRREESTKYFVNGLECERENIYQTILNNKFYKGTLSLDKVYHFQLKQRQVRKESTLDRQSEGYYNVHTQTSEQDEKIDKSANFNLETKKFVERFEPNSDEFKLLITKMIYVLDMFYECQDRYSEYAIHLRAAIRDCITFVSENITDSKAPYNNLMHALGVEQFVFFFDVIAFGLSQSIMDKKFSGKAELPQLAFDMSSIKEEWDEKWSNPKKSQFVKEYLSVLLKQTEATYQVWKKNDLFKDSASQNEIRNRFYEFKKFIKDLQAKKIELDASIPEVRKHSISAKIVSFFHKPHTSAGEVFNNIPEESNNRRAKKY